LWTDYAQRRPARVPLRWSLNPRIIRLNPALNPDGWSFAEDYRDPAGNGWFSFISPAR